MSAPIVTQNETAPSPAVANTRRHFRRSFAQYRYDAEVFRRVLNEYPIQGQLVGNWGIDNESRGRFILNGY